MIDKFVGLSCDF